MIMVTVMDYTVGLPPSAQGYTKTTVIIAMTIIFMDKATGKP